MALPRSIQDNGCAGEGSRVYAYSIRDHRADARKQRGPVHEQDKREVKSTLG